MSNINQEEHDDDFEFDFDDPIVRERIAPNMEWYALTFIIGMVIGALLTK